VRKEQKEIKNKKNTFFLDIFFRRKRDEKRRRNILLVEQLTVRLGFQIGAVTIG